MPSRTPKQAATRHPPPTPSPPRTIARWRRYATARPHDLTRPVRSMNHHSSLRSIGHCPTPAAFPCGRPRWRRPTPMRSGQLPGAAPRPGRGRRRCGEGAAGARPCVHHLDSSDPPTLGKCRGSRVAHRIQDDAYGPWELPRKHDEPVLNAPRTPAPHTAPMRRVGPGAAVRRHGRATPPRRRLSLTREPVPHSFGHPRRLAGPPSHCRTLVRKWVTWRIPHSPMFLPTP